MNRYWEPRLAAYIVQVLPGELCVTGDDVVISTVLGSCVSACLRDTGRAIGGINHFMLPYGLRGDDAASARYGVYALECLVNQVIGSTGTRIGLEAKVFGGGRVIEGGSDIGLRNIELVREFFTAERIPVISEDLGATYARRIRYWPRTGRAQVQRIPMARAREVVLNEDRTAHELSGAAGAVELF
jgi:chemotaxis protein CheD